jgi:hypothetical protein
MSQADGARMVSRVMMHPGCVDWKRPGRGGTPSGKYDFRVQRASEHLPVTNDCFRLLGIGASVDRVTQARRSNFWMVPKSLARQVSQICHLRVSYRTNPELASAWRRLRQRLRQTPSWRPPELMQRSKITVQPC